MPNSIPKLRRSFKARLATFLNRNLSRAELAIYRFRERAHKLPASIQDYLQGTNPYLTTLRKRYVEFGMFEHSFWQEWRGTLDLQRFRQNGDFLAQSYEKGRRLNYMLTTAYAEALDDWHLLWELSEDCLFGAMGFKFAGDLLVTRDLLDSVLEITFLKNELGLKRDDTLRILDIGAGYGRFAHRFSATFPNSHVTCIDAVPESTFLCDFYIKHRNFESQAASVPLYERDSLIGKTFDLAVNIHSWPECTLATITNWLEFIVACNIRRLLVIPHAESFWCTEPDGSKPSFLGEIERHGFRLRKQIRKFERSRLLQEEGIFNTAYALFER